MINHVNEYTFLSGKLMNILASIYLFCIFHRLPKFKAEVKTMLLTTLPRCITNYFTLRGPWRLNKSPDVFLSEGGSTTRQKSIYSLSDEQVERLQAAKTREKHPAK